MQHAPDARGCLPPVFIDRVFDDPGCVRRWVEANQPYLPVQRYFDRVEEYRALSGRTGASSAMIVAPNFRGNWADRTPLAEGGREILEHRPFIDGAAKLFDGSIVRPWLVFVNITWQLPFDQGAGHTDVPAFRGIDRSTVPIWLLTAMGHSGLFEDERIRIATAVAWFYGGSDGGFTWWPDGPDRPPRIHEGAIHNTACVGDNDRMFHRVRPVGRREDGLPRGLTLDTRLERCSGSRWQLREDDSILAEMPFEELRISLSWKCAVFRDEAEADLVDSHRADLDLDTVIDRFGEDLEARGVAFERPGQPLSDPAFVELLADQYVRAPAAG